MASATNSTSSRLHGGSHRHQFPHQLIVNVETSAGIQHDEIVSLLSPSFDASLANTNHITVGGLCLFDSMDVDFEVAPKTC